MLTGLDIAVIALWLLGSLGAGLLLARRAGASTESFFVGGRSLPWWVVGTSMVATTFAADTPLAVSGWVADDGVAANWLWWNFAMTGTVAVFLFAPLWRRSRVITDAELVELRYGRPGAWLRGFKAVWFGVFFNALVIGWVTRAMVKITATLAGWSPDGPATTWAVVGLFVLAVGYTVAAGLWGVVATDVAQFALAMGGSLVFAVLAWNHAGGLAGLQAGFAEHGFDWAATTALVPLGPAFEGGWDGATAGFAILVGFLWATGHNLDGGGYLAQRLAAAKDERHARLAYLWFTVAHLVLRPWPWIVVGLVGMATLGPVGDAETYYPRMMAEVLPAGLFGAMIAAFLAAYMSTLDTQLHWGASLLVNDVWRRFVRPDASDAHHVAASRWAIVGVALLGALASFAIEDIGAAWKLAISVTAGLGTVYAARWFWWRTSAWSEGAAMLAAAGFTAVYADWPFPVGPALVALSSVPVWLAVTALTPPPERAVLEAFHDRVHPGGPGWVAIAGEAARHHGPNGWTALGIVSGVVGVLGALLGVGWGVLGHGGWAAGALGFAALGTAGVVAGVRGEQATRGLRGTVGNND